MAPRTKSQATTQPVTSAPTAAIKRIDGVIIVSTSNGNPNGDPDASGAPRQNPYSQKGMISPMAPKRRIRDNILRMDKREEGYDVFIQRNAALEEQKKVALEVAGRDTKDKDAQVAAAESWMLDKFADVRMFGATFSTSKDYKLNNYRGAVNIYWGESVDPIDIVEPTSTRMSSERDRSGDGKENKTMFQSHIVPYGLYVIPFHINPFQARKNHMRQSDLDYLRTRGFAEIFENTSSTMLGDTSVVGIYAFVHDNDHGVPGISRTEILRNFVQIRRSSTGPAQSLTDYDIRVAAQDQLPAGLTLEVWKKPFKLDLF